MTGSPVQTAKMKLRRTCCLLFGPKCIGAWKVRMIPNDLFQKQFRAHKQNPSCLPSRKEQDRCHPFQVPSTTPTNIQQPPRSEWARHTHDFLVGILREVELGEILLCLLPNQSLQARIDVDITGTLLRNDWSTWSSR